MPANVVSATPYAGIRLIGRALGAAGVTAHRSGALACAVVLLQACNGSDAVAPDAPFAAAIRTETNLGSAVVGTALDQPVRVVVTSPDGSPRAGARVTWTASNGGSTSPATTLTDAKGQATVRWTLGSAAGSQTVTADVAAGSPVTFSASAEPDRPAAITFGVSEARLRQPGDSLRIVPRVVDRFGNVSPVPVALTIDGSGTVATLDGATLIARKRGSVTLRATADSATALLPVVVDPTAATVTSVSPDTIVAGAKIVLMGEGFPALPEQAEVVVGGYRTTVTAISPTRIEAVMPSADLACQATATVPVKVIVAGVAATGSAVLRTATRIDLAKGESASMLAADATRCTELAQPAGIGAAKYVVAVINTSVTPGTTVGYELRGIGSGGLAGLTAVAVAPPAVTSVGLMSAGLMSAGASSSTAPGMAARTNALSSLPADLREAMSGDRRHAAQLDAQLDLSRRYGSPAPAWNAFRTNRSGSRAAGIRVAAAVGDTVPMKALYNSCSRGADIRARIVYAGSRAVVLEDIAAPRARETDDEYRAIGEEFDRVGYPLLLDKIGDPLAMNASMDGDGRVTMLFTRYVNDSLPGIAGYVTACNFYPKSTFAGSNEDEVFYARVPAIGESADEWRRGMRSTIIHEAKHLASFAERFSRGSAFEEPWLEESTARIAEELYSRTFENGGGWKSNTGYASVRCEVSRCDSRPLMMWKHFSVLHQYLRGVDTLTPIGAANSGDFTYYASGWSLVRWAADQYAGDEGTWLKALIRGGSATGLANLAAQTGHGANEMLADWALANAVDDLDGFTPTRRQLTFPSWNTADVMRGLSQAYPGMFVAAPLNARTMSFGTFALPVARLRAFSSSYFSFEGSQAGSQVIELRGEGGAAVPAAGLRLAVVRVE